MRLVWHIVVKDLRRLALPVAVWLTLILLPTVAFRWALPAVDGHIASSISASVAAASIWARLLLGMQLLIGFVLASTLIIADSPVDPAGFWMTRPIAPGRLLMAKLISAVLLFLVAPVVGLAPVWLASGFDVREVWLAVWEFAQWQGPATLLALVLASLSRTLAQVLFSALLLAGAGVLCLWLTAPLHYSASSSLRSSREILASVILIVTAAVGLAQQFLRRWPVRGWMIMVVGVCAGVAVRAAWPWDIANGFGRGSDAAAFEERSGDQSAEIVVTPNLTAGGRSPNAVPNMFVTAPWGREMFCLPVWAKFSDGAVGRGAMGPGEVEAGLRTIGFSRGDGPLRWQVMTPTPWYRTVGKERWTGVLEIWAVRPQILGEIPLEVGATISAGANRTRIVALGRNQGRLDEIFIEERDVHSAAVGGESSNRSPADAQRLSTIDRYFLVDRSKKSAQSARAGEVGSLDVNSLSVRFRRLHVSGDHDGQGVMLVKLRYGYDHRFERPFDVQFTPSTQP